MLAPATERPRERLLQATAPMRSRPPRTRLRWLAAGAAAAWLVLAGRLVQIQALERAEYAESARQQHHRWIEGRARRGMILDRHGRQLALDTPATSFYCDPQRVEEPEQVAAHFAALSGRPVSALRQQLRSSRRFLYLLRQADDPTAAAARGRTFNGVFELPETRRNYPNGRLAGQLLGFTDIDNRGQEGLEQALEPYLAGTEGRALYRVDSRGRALPGEPVAQDGETRHGSDVILSIDAAYQGILEEELAAAMERTQAESGLGLITDPRTGEILAAASVPLFDPNCPGEVAATLRRNRPVTDAYEPGSTFKAIALAAVLEERLATPETQVFCENGSLALRGGQTIRDVHPNGWLSMADVLAKSSNIGAIKLAERLPRPTFYEYLRAFGLGIRTGIGLPAESSGLLRNAADWSDRSLQTMTIGQEVSVTPLQLVQAFGAVANGGFLMAPILQRQVSGPDGEAVDRTEPQPLRRVVSASTAQTMRQMLERVVTDGTGKRGAVAGMRVAGKTGTAQRALPGGRGYSADQFIVSFLGFLPADEPRLLCLIAIDNPRRERWGGEAAAPAFARTMERILALPNGGFPRPAPAAERQQPSSRLGNASELAAAMPDLRGLTPELVRYHCRLRGLAVQLGGEGEIAIEQDPAPGQPLPVDGAVTCRLGQGWETAQEDRASAPARQAVLMQMLGPDWGRGLALLQR
ncbi:MAG: penicillin-binding transpeptidase domain-containing protein [Gemmatimonadota bacterium]